MSTDEDEASEWAKHGAALAKRRYGNANPRRVWELRKADVLQRMVLHAVRGPIAVGTQFVHYAPTERFLMYQRRLERVEAMQPPA